MPKLFLFLFSLCLLLFSLLQYEICQNKIIGIFISGISVVIIRVPAVTVIVNVYVMIINSIFFGVAWIVWFIFRIFVIVVIVSGYGVVLVVI